MRKLVCLIAEMPMLEPDPKEKRMDEIEMALEAVPERWQEEVKEALEKE